MSKQFWAVVAVVVIVLVGIFAFTGKKDNTGSNGNANNATNHVEGKSTTGVKLVEYGDFQCPYCQLYSSTVKSAVASYGDQISFQFRNFPLTSIHRNAFAAARAAEAAGKQNKYWEMHDVLYQNSDPNGASGWVASNSPSSYFNRFAQQIGLNVNQFKTDYASSAVNDAINADIAAGNKLNVDATPTFFLDGKKVQIGNTEADFKKVLDAAIKSKQSGGNGTTNGSGSAQQSTGSSSQSN